MPVIPLERQRQVPHFENSLVHTVSTQTLTKRIAIKSRECSSVVLCLPSITTNKQVIQPGTNRKANATTISNDSHIKKMVEPFCSFAEDNISDHKGINTAKSVGTDL